MRRRRNERRAEKIITDKLRDLGYYKEKGIEVEEQNSSSDRIRTLLNTASKSGSGKPGHPEFIIRKENSDVLIVIECKPEKKQHESPNKDDPVNYAVDGVLHYASFLKAEFNVIAIAFSGENSNDCLLSIYQWNKTGNTYLAKKYDDLMTYADYYSLFHATDENPLTEEELLKYAQTLHNELRDEAKLQESEKPIFVAALLLALENGDFLKEYPVITDPKRLARRIIESIEEALKNVQFPQKKIDTLKNEFGFITANPYLTGGRIDAENPSHENNPLHKFLVDLHTKVSPFIKKEGNIDIMGRFYSEFLRYAGGDGSLGIILTPTHITELFCELAEVNKHSKVIDICCGTGGFLISAMHYMLKDDPTVPEINDIHNHNLVGIETLANMFTLACANMILRGDGKTNLEQDNCFRLPLSTLQKYQCNIGLINPPYAQKKEEESELVFVKRLLDVLTVGGIGIAIIPLSCVTSNKENNALKDQILREHTLKAVMSMPDTLFGDQANAVTCIVVFEAHRRHDPEKETWFGYWKKDGFKKMRNLGRIDNKKLYETTIKKEWLDMYFNRRVIDGVSALHAVGYQDEWLVEPYLKTNYANLSVERFEDALREYATYRFRNKLTDQVTAAPYLTKQITLDTLNWKEIEIRKLFTVKGAKRTPKEELDLEVKKYPYVTTQTENNGVDGFYGTHKNSGNVLVIDSAVKGFCSYQAQDFAASDHVEVLTPIPPLQLNVYIALFLATVINLEQYRYSYGRKFNQDRIRNTRIRLPFKDGGPDWTFMEEYIKSLNYSRSVEIPASSMGAGKGKDFPSCALSILEEQLKSQGLALDLAAQNLYKEQIKEVLREEQLEELDFLALYLKDDIHAFVSNLIKIRTENEIFTPSVDMEQLKKAFAKCGPHRIRC